MPESEKVSANFPSSLPSSQAITVNSFASTITVDIRLIPLHCLFLHISDNKFLIKQLAKAVRLDATYQGVLFTTNFRCEKKFHSFMK